MNAPLLHQIRKPREVVYESLKRQIMINELRPESALTELGMAREHGCSQGTIREALFRLQEDGLVTRSGHRGTMVTRLDPEEAEEILALGAANLDAAPSARCSTSTRQRSNGCAPFRRIWRTWRRAATNMP